MRRTDALGAPRADLDDAEPHPLLAAYLERRAELVRYFRVRLRSNEAAEDLVQDIYLKVARPPAEPIDNPGAFLFRLGSNLMLDRMKQAQRAQRRDGAWQGVAAATLGGETIVDTPAADEVLAARQRLTQTLAALADLPAPVREAFRLHKLEGLTHAETAAAMGVSRSSVEKYIMTSLKRILERVGR